MTGDTHNTPLPMPTYEREAKVAKAALAGLQKRLDGIRDVIEAGGPVSDKELRQIYRLATGMRR